MGSTILWNTRRLRWRDLPTLQDLFDSCDRALLEQVIIEEFACRDVRVSKGRYAAMQHRLDASLDAMESLPLDKKANRGWLLAPQASYLLNACAGSVSWRLHMALVPRCDTAGLEGLIRDKGGFATSYSHIGKTRKHRCRPAASPGNCSRDQVPGALGERSYTLAPWEEILACKAWLGGDWCCRERYIALASAFWEMTFFGFEYDRVQARMAQEKAARMMMPVDQRRTGRSSEDCDEMPSYAYGLNPPDRLVRKSRRRMAERIAVLNHNEDLAFYERLLDLSKRLKGRR
ncbi:MAG: hypothetical protein RRZ85_02730 [Gordonibacter sp.]|uniref:hypothetical protein n=1 Tax=Gordonibacter sp. TaxID=1968902 RepID=UPI002FC85DC4